jgi:hypothetical protein
MEMNGVFAELGGAGDSGNGENVSSAFKNRGCNLAGVPRD